MIFILSDYEEDGADNVIVVDNRDDLFAAIDENWPVNDNGTRQSADTSAWKERAKERLRELLANMSDEQLSENSGKHNLHKGWGGIQLHVRKIYSPK